MTNPDIQKRFASTRGSAAVFEDPASRALLQSVEQLGPRQASVLLLGETGTGKEVVARQLHALSARRERAFVAVNCGALTASLVESELFGHERGAFTGAAASKIGWFEAAHGGTLFLDEIAELSLPTQVKLLRVLQERQIVRLGSRDARAIDVRLIAASNVPLARAVEAGRFRADLYYRLNVAPLHIPPLRQRRGDILPLAERFVQSYSRKLGLRNVSLAPETIDTLLTYPWPGNIRELENVIHRALIVHAEGPLHLDALLRRELGPRARTPAGPRPNESFDSALRMLFEAELPNLFQYIEERLIRTAHAACDRNQVQTARRLGMHRSLLRERLLQYGETSAACRRSEPPPAD